MNLNFQILDHNLHCFQSIFFFSLCYQTYHHDPQILTNLPNFFPLLPIFIKWIALYDPIQKLCKFYPSIYHNIVIFIYNLFTYFYRAEFIIVFTFKKVVAINIIIRVHASCRSFVRMKWLNYRKIKVLLIFLNSCFT